MPKNLNCEINEILFKKFKVTLAIKGETVKDVINKLVEDYVRKNNLKSVK